MTLNEPPLKCRASLFSDEIIASIKSIASELGEEDELDFEQLDYDKNPINFLRLFYPKYSIGEVGRKFKSITARELFKLFSSLKKAVGWVVGNFGLMDIMFQR